MSKRHNMPTAPCDESLKRFAGGVAHDFGNLLTAIHGYTSMALEETLPQTAQTCLKNVEKAAQRAMALNARLLAFATKPPAPKEAINLNDAVQKAKPRIEEAMGEAIQVDLQLADDLWTTQMQADFIERLLLDFAQAAKERMQGRGRLQIATRNAPPKEIEDEERVILEISDAGREIAPELQSKIFEPYFAERPAEKGAGLSLALCHNIITQSGGEIQVFSEAALGTSFHIYLPRAAKKEVEIATPMTKEDACAAYAGTETILVVDDEPSLLTLITLILEARGYTVLQALSAEQALDVLNRYQGRIDMLVTDMMMPGITGKELAERIQSERSPLPTLYVSGYTAHHLARQGNLVEAQNLLPKPFHAADLLQRVRQFLDKAGASQPTLA